MHNKSNGGLVGTAGRFIKNNVKVGSYNDKSLGIKSAYGVLGRPGKGYIGGTLGTQNGKPFGGANINGKPIGSFGMPQGQL